MGEPMNRRTEELTNEQERTNKNERTSRRTTTTQHLTNDKSNNITSVCKPKSPSFIHFSVTNVPFTIALRFTICAPGTSKTKLKDKKTSNLPYANEEIHNRKLF